MARSNYNPLITSEEWRWIIIASGLLAALTLVPYAWALASNNNAVDAEFMGMLANPKDGATYLAKMEQGYRGDILFHLPYTPEPHSGAAINLYYLILGHLARLTGQSALVIYHVARVLGGLFMFIALYQFGAAVWTRERPRRLFFGLAGLGSGLSWLFLVLSPEGFLDVASNRLPPDLTMPEAYPLYAVYTNPHFPLAIGLLALIGSIYIQVFRPGTQEHPTLYNQGIILILASVLLAIVQPQALVPIGVTLGVYLVVRYVRTRKLPRHEAIWSLLLWAPAAPFVAYYFAITQINPAIAAWSEQNVTLSPPFYYYVIGFAPLLLVALPGLVRAVRKFEPDGDQIVLTWLAVNALLLYAPLNLQRRLVIGLILPLTYFAVRGIEDYWSLTVPQRAQRIVLILLFVFLLPSNVLALGIPLVGAVANKEYGVENNILLEKDYINTLGWLSSERGRVNVPLVTDGRPTVLLASPDFSMFIPAWAGHRVVYAHPYETIHASQKLEAVTAWYQGTGCQELLEGDTWQGKHWQVDYVIVGPREREIGENGCYTELEDLVGLFGDVVVYKVR